MSLRSSLATGSATPLTPAKMDALPSSPPREVWVMDSSSCWTFSRMNTCLSGEKQVRGDIIHLIQWLAYLLICHTLTVCGQVCGCFVCWCVQALTPVKLRDKTSSKCLDSLVKHIFTACCFDTAFFDFLQMRRPLKLGSKFRSTVRTSRPSLTSSGLEWRLGFRHLFPARNRG